ncbi:MAG: type II toxin-antitoxin system HipA family toxin [Rhodobacter sp.]|nr:type II toxin-antitoxin system HipA family toxin [Rhodobacter sp.]MCY4168982.1 type II toxin-antitoxin system HipA family toxin [Rhodobacter sp.]MCY4242876.1 type II toxin-antitoxin system HipA family toxin [Rhodobacter sp.]
MADRLIIWWNDDVVGQLTLNQYGEPEFSYAPNWLAKPGARAVSVSLPLRPEPFDRRATLPFFEGLLPEATQRTTMARALGVSERNEFRLLEEIGREVAGAIEIWPEGTGPAAAGSTKPPRALSEDDLAALIDRLPTRPMLAGGEDGLRLSLAGAQSKLPVVLTVEGIALPALGQPTTHILKQEIARFEGTTENEAFCMRLARTIGLEAAGVEYRNAGGKRFLLIERYDRRAGEDGQIIRLHQEDLCQALGYTSARKYASDGGPVFRDCFDLVRRVTTRPAAETLKLLDAVLFNLVIGNADAHAKNFSLLYLPDGTNLAPLYDLLCTVAYPDLSPRFAMKIGGCRTLGEIRPAHLEKFARDIEIRAPFIRKRLGEIAEAIIEKADATLDAIALPEERQATAEAYSILIQKRANAAKEMSARAS